MITVSRIISPCACFFCHNDGDNRMLRNVSTSETLALIYYITRSSIYSRLATLPYILNKHASHTLQFFVARGIYSSTCFTISA
jgi:hypothetical protein